MLPKNCDPPSKPRVLAILPGLIPSTLIHIVKPLMAAHRAGWIAADFALEYSVSRRNLERAAVVIFCRNTEPVYDWILDFALSAGKPVVYDLDDNFFEVPPTTDVGRYHRAPERLAQLQRYLTHATLVRVYSETLREWVARLNPRVVRVEGPIDWSLTPKRPVSRDLRKVRVVYATSRVEDDLASLFLGDIRHVLAMYGDRIEIVFWGYHPPELRRHPAVRCLPPLRSYDRFFRKFAHYGFDIGLAPLRDDVFHRSKSNVKFREYAACGIAGVYSDVKPYAEVVEHGVTGLLVPNQPGAWSEAICRLVENGDLRAAIQRQARAYARAHYDLTSVQEQWKHHIREALAAAPLSHRPVDRVRGHRQSANALPGRIRLMKQALRRWMGRVSKVIPHLRHKGWARTLHLMRWSLNGGTMLVRARMTLRFWSLYRVGLACMKKVTAVNNGVGRGAREARATSSERT